MSTGFDNLRLVLGLKLRAAREARSRTLQETASAAGVAVSYLSEIEKGKKFPKPQPLTYASRGDRDAAPTVSESFKEYCEEGNSCYAEYVYVYDQGFWSCYTCPDCVLTNI